MDQGTSIGSMNNPERPRNKLVLTAAMLCLLFVVGCAAIPQGPSVMVLPGSGSNFSQFQYDDGACRDWSAHQVGKTGSDAAVDSTVTGAAIGTAVGAATGAALGAAVGDPGTGAAIGSGVGLLGGTSAGLQQGAYADYEIQRRYDISYMQCMYSRGHRIPVPRGASQERSAALSDAPPPPRGRPPAPPPPVY
jgi:hypothetical protein